jgi:hypothetical protein
MALLMRFRIRSLCSATFRKYPAGFDRDLPISISLKQLARVDRYAYNPDILFSAFATIVRGVHPDLNTFVEVTDLNELDESERNLMLQNISDNILSNLGDPEFIKQFPDVWMTYLLKGFAKLNWWKKSDQLIIITEEVKRRIVEYEKNNVPCFELAYGALLAISELKYANWPLLEACSRQILKRMTNKVTPLIPSYVTQTMSAFSTFMFSEKDLFDAYAQEITNRFDEFKTAYHASRIFWVFGAQKMSISQELLTLYGNHFSEVGMQDFTSRQFSLVLWSLAARTLDGNINFKNEIKRCIPLLINENSKPQDISYVAYFLGRQRIYDTDLVKHIVDLTRVYSSKYSKKDLETVAVLVKKAKYTE